MWGYCIFYCFVRKGVWPPNDECWQSPVIVDIYWFTDHFGECCQFFQIPISQCGHLSVFVDMHYSYTLNVDIWMKKCTKLFTKNSLHIVSSIIKFNSNYSVNPVALGLVYASILTMVYPANVWQSDCLFDSINNSWTS